MISFSSQGTLHETGRWKTSSKKKMVILQPKRLHWIQDIGDDSFDLCAHGEVEFRIDDDIVLFTHGENLTVSAAALYLLRTLTAAHTKSSRVSEHLFPCCGFTMVAIPEEADVLIFGCVNGEDVEVDHQENGDGVIIRMNDGREWKVTWTDWRTAVFAFADRVSEFYESSSPKEYPDDDAAGYLKFLDEWQRRRGKSLGQT
jgi:hypothetical protein